jgi:hypothetical protein
MPSLLDSSSEGALHLFRVVALGYDQAAGDWPCWQWVKQQLWLQDRDAEEILQGLPTWRHGYRSVRVSSHGQLPDNSDAVPLTVHGMANTVVPSMRHLVRGFLTAVNIAIVTQRGITPSVSQPVELKMSGEDFIREVNGRANLQLSVEQLFGVLRGEPATWRGVNQNDGQWAWDLADIRLSRYVGLQNEQDYLRQLDEMVGLPAVSPPSAILPPMALPEALDHLDLAWRLATGEHLVRVPRAATAAKLTQPVSSVEEFESRCSALSDLLGSLNLPSQGGTLQNMKAKLAELLGENAGRAQAAVDILRWAVALRVGQQHRGADVGAERAKVALGLASYDGQWDGAWDRLRVVTVQALDTVREEIGSLTVEM